MNLLDENIQSLQQLIKAPLLGTIPHLHQELTKTPYTKLALETAASYIRLPD
jgi:cobyric acid synthase